MIENLRLVLQNGARTRIGQYLPDVPILEQINDPAFRPRAYEWENGARTYVRSIDGKETVVAHALPDSSGLVVLQSPETYGTDNVIAVDDSNQIVERVANPYRKSKFFLLGDRYCFDSIRIEQALVVLGIQVQRHLPGKDHDAVPIYEARYDPTTWRLEKLEWRPWT